MSCAIYRACSGGQVGRVDDSGRVYSASSGGQVGRVDSGGTVYNNAGQLGSIKGSGDMYKAGAALLLLLNYKV